MKKRPSAGPPLLVGSVQDWSGHLARIAGMQFDWVFLNPIHYPGFSGSLYAVKDPYRLLDEMREQPTDLPPEPEGELLARIARLDGLLGRLIETLERDP